MENISRETRKARKRHCCDYCGNYIEKGETYRHSINKADGGLYSWKSHEKCAELAGIIWDIVDPDEGMTADQFCDNLREVDILSFARNALIATPKRMTATVRFG